MTEESSHAFSKNLLGPDWAVSIEPDVVDTARLQEHRIPAQDSDKFYGNRVSVEGMVFKGEVYMPWKFVVGTAGASHAGQCNREPA